MHHLRRRHSRRDLVPGRENTLKLRAKLILPIILITAAMSLLTVYLITDDLERDALVRAQHVTAEYIIAKAMNG